MDNIKLWKNPPLFSGRVVPDLKPFPAEGEKRPAIIVCPGGAYGFLAYDQEGYDCAEWFQKLGISSYVLTYRLAPDHYPCQLMDVQRAIRTLRFHAEELSIDPNKIGIIGFSAGGHLAGSAAVHFREKLCPTDKIDEVSARPDFAILSYPVISAESFGHQESVVNFLGEEKAADPKWRDFFSLEKNVTPEMPPVFIWHTAEDACVPVENALVMASALAKHKVPVELHLYPYGPHGQGQANGVHSLNLPYLNQWTKSCEAWLREVAKIF